MVSKEKWTKNMMTTAADTIISKSFDGIFGDKR